MTPNYREQATVLRRAKQEELDVVPSTAAEIIIASLLEASANREEEIAEVAAQITFLRGTGNWERMDGFKAAVKQAASIAQSLLPAKADALTEAVLNALKGEFGASTMFGADDLTSIAHRLADHMRDKVRPVGDG